MADSPTSVLPTRIDPAHGKVDAQSPLALKEAGNDAMRMGDFTRATHMYTLGVDMIIGKNETPAEAADWYTLDMASNGVLHVLLSNRSLTHLKQNDAAAAAVDAEAACLARPDFVKAHLRLLAALEAGEAPLEERREACTRGLRACPRAKELVEMKVALDAEAGVAPGGEAALAEEAARLAAQLAATKLVADDEADPRRAMAAGDYGSALALGAYGVAKDLNEARRYLQIGSDGGDAAASRNLGMLLLEESGSASATEMPSSYVGEAAEHLRRAAELGDEEAAATLKQLTEEADKAREQALGKLRALAASGDERAKAMLESL